MITSLHLKQFKNFKDATLRLGSFTVLIGANASGKSNIRDAFLFLHGIGRGYSLAEILGEKYVGGERVWGGIRGGIREVAYWGLNDFALTVRLKIYSSESQAARSLRARLLHRCIRRGSQQEVTSQGAPRVDKESLIMPTLLVFRPRSGSTRIMSRSSFRERKGLEENTLLPGVIFQVHRSSTRFRRITKGRAVWREGSRERSSRIWNRFASWTCHRPRCVSLRCRALQH